MKHSCGSSIRRGAPNEATVRVGPHDGRLVADTVLWGDQRAIEGGRVSVPARDAFVIRLLQQMA